MIGKIEIPIIPIVFSEYIQLQEIKTPLQVSIAGTPIRRTPKKHHIIYKISFVSSFIFYFEYEPLKK